MYIGRPKRTWDVDFGVGYVRWRPQTYMGIYPDILITDFVWPVTLYRPSILMQATPAIC